MRMVDIETIRESLLVRMENESLLQFLDTGRSQFLDLADEMLIEIVLTDAFVEEQVRALVAQAVGAWDGGGKKIDWIVRSLWTIDHFGKTEVARSLSGAIVTATLVPVWLRSGRKEAVVHVAITYLAKRELEDLIGFEPDLGKMAETYVGSLLRRGGRSAWNPLDVRNRQLEINAALALDLHRVLAKTA